MRKKEVGKALIKMATNDEESYQSFLNFLRGEGNKLEQEREQWIQKIIELGKQILNYRKDNESVEQLKRDLTQLIQLYRKQRLQKQKVEQKIAKQTKNNDDFRDTLEKLNQKISRLTMTIAGGGVQSKKVEFTSRIKESGKSKYNPYNSSKMLAVKTEEKTELTYEEIQLKKKLLSLDRDIANQRLQQVFQTNDLLKKEYEAKSEDCQLQLSKLLTQLTEARIGQGKVSQLLKDKYDKLLLSHIASIKETLELVSRQEDQQVLLHTQNQRIRMQNLDLSYMLVQLQQKTKKQQSQSMLQQQLISRKVGDMYYEKLELQKSTDQIVDNYKYLQARYQTALEALRSTKNQKIHEYASELRKNNLEVYRLKVRAPETPPGAIDYSLIQKRKERGKSAKARLEQEELDEIKKEHERCEQERKEFAKIYSRQREKAHAQIKKRRINRR